LFYADSGTELQMTEFAVACRLLWLVPMAPSAAVIARDQRTGLRTALAGYRAGAALLDVAIA
jgi:hypothetical protein